MIFIKKIFKSRGAKFIFSTICIVLAMCLSYVVSYNVIRKNAPSKNEGASNIQGENYSYEKPFPNLPVTISGIYEENSNFTTDTNDYLVISEGNLVNLYVIDKDENKTFERILEIDLASLKPEDKMLLKNGILLGDRSALLSLIEDYSS